MNSSTRICTVLLILLLCSQCFAAVPGIISYQGKLTDTAGQPVSDGQHSLTFRLFSQASGGTALWTESQQVQVNGGMFSALLGSTTEVPSSAFQGSTYLEVQVNGNTIALRTRIVSAGYAIVAKAADTVSDGSITSAKIAAGAVTSSAILDGSVSTADLADGSVTTSKLHDNSVTSSKILLGSVNNAALADNSVTSIKIAMGAVTSGKLGGDVRFGVNASVEDHGAVGNGATDDTAAFQSALDAVAAQNGGIVWVPAGTYKISTQLTIPSHVTLEGVYRAPAGNYTSSYGSTLLAVEGAGNENGTPFITMGAQSVLKGITIFYPDQSNVTPVAYPWCIRGTGDGIAVIDVLLVNPWQGVDLGTTSCPRHLVRGLYGQTIKTGIWIDKCTDTGRLENVHLWPFWQTQGGAADYTASNGIGFKIQRADHELISGSFAISFNMGFQFLGSTGDPLSGKANAQMINSGGDVCNWALRVDDCASPWGVSVANSQMFGLVEVMSTNTGFVKFSSTGIWGRGGYAVKTGGSGAVILTGCNFANYSSSNGALYDDCARFTVTGCDFHLGGKHLTIAATTPNTVVIVGNQYRATENITNNSATAQVIKANNATR